MAERLFVKAERGADLTSCPSHVYKSPEGWKDLIVQQTLAPKVKIL